jgi:CheY-like chemotaxis protein
VPLSTANDSPALVVLLVEDEFVIRWSVADSLRDAGYIVVETASGEEAIAICGSGVSVELLFTDINLLGPKTGWDVADSFRAQRPKVAVLYTSGGPIDASRRVCGSEFLAKPYQISNVVEIRKRSQNRPLITGFSFSLKEWRTAPRAYLGTSGATASF